MKYIDRVPYFLYLTKTPLSLVLQIWQLQLVLDTLSSPWPQTLLVPTN